MGSKDESFALYGQAFDDIVEGDGISKKPLSIENQIVTDEKGRRRFHGAFTGGFSAGHFNTVGTIEGWVPSTFVSSRGTRADAKSRKPEDFMDKEDLGEYGIAPRNIRTTKDFTEEEDALIPSSSSSSLEKDRKRRLVWEHTELAAEADKLSDLIKPINDSVGILMLKRMGWRPGKGVGPLVKRKSKEIVTGDDTFAPSDFKFAPDDVDFHVFEPKSDLHGLGYAGFDPSVLLQQSATTKESALKTNNKQRKGIQGQAFGVGAFEEDDEDVYSVDDLTKYDFALTGGLSSNLNKNKSVDDDFEIGKLTLTPRKFFPPPKISRDYAPAVPFVGKEYQGGSSKQNVDTSQRIDSSSLSLNPNQRSFILGESSSVWSLVSDKDKNRIEEIKTSQQANVSSKRSSRFDRKTPPRNLHTPAKPLSTESPVKEKVVHFPNDSIKSQRFDEFVNYLKRGLSMPQPVDTTEWEWESEQDEFRKLLPDDLLDAYANSKIRSKPLCQTSLVQPFVSIMKSKFTHATHDDEDVVEKQTNEDQDKLKAVQLKMFGPMTREKHEWHPHKNLCKRLNLPNPYPDSRVTGVPYFQKDVKANAMKLVGLSFHSTSDELAERQAASRDSSLSANQQTPSRDARRNVDSSHNSKFNSINVIEEDNNVPESAPAPDILEEDQRPSLDLFRTIFAESAAESSSSEDETLELCEEQKIVKPSISGNVVSASLSMALDNENSLNAASQMSNIFATSTSFEPKDIATFDQTFKDAHLEYGPALPSLSVDEGISLVSDKSSSKHSKHKRHRSRDRKKAKKSKKSSAKRKKHKEDKHQKTKRHSSSSYESSAES